MPITLDQVRAEAPELITALKAEGQAEGAAAETARVKGCLDLTEPGYEFLAMAFALDGKTTPGDAALAISAKRKADLQAAHANATNPTQGAPVLPVGEDPEAAEVERAKQAESAKDGGLKARWDSNASIRNLYGSFEAYKKANEGAEAAAASGRILQKAK